MATIPPVARVREKIRDWILRKQATAAVELSPEQVAVADWLRGNKQAYETLCNLFRARIEGRGMLAVPSNPHDAVVRLAADAEVRSIMAEIRFLTSQPVVPLASVEEQDE